MIQKLRHSPAGLYRQVSSKEHSIETTQRSIDLFLMFAKNKSMGLPPSRDWSHSGFSRQSQSGTLDKAVSSDFASGGIQMVLVPFKGGRSLTLKDKPDRWVNVVVGLLYAVLLALIILRSNSRGTSPAMIFNTCCGFVAALLTIWYAWK